MPTAARQLESLLLDLERRGITVMDLMRRGQPPEPWRLYPTRSRIARSRS
jgi:hypothetical protein